MPPTIWTAGRGERKNGAPSEADRDGDERHRVRRDARVREAAADRERDRAVEVPRHEALFVLDRGPEAASVLGAPAGPPAAHDGDADRASLPPRARCRSRTWTTTVPGQRARRPATGVADEARAPVPSSGRERASGEARDDLDPRESGAARPRAPCGGRAAGRGAASPAAMPGPAGGATRARIGPGVIASSGADRPLGGQRLAAAALDSCARARTLAQSAASARLWPRARGLSTSREELGDDAAEPVGMVRALGQRRKAPLLDRAARRRRRESDSRPPSSCELAARSGRAPSRLRALLGRPGQEDLRRGADGWKSISSAVSSIG